MSNHTLYLCYFGLREPLVQTQVLPYLREIKKLNDLKVSLLTFEPNFKEKWTPEQIEAERKKLADENINWHCLPYHKNPSVPATIYDILCGAFFAWRMIRREKVDVLHARVHVPGIMSALARKFSGRRPKLLFDIRGFFPEEYVDAGVWEETGWVYKSVKRVEKWILKEADGFVVLTEKAREILFPESKETGFDKLGRPIEVIPCCVNLKKFEAADENSRLAMREKLNLQNRPVITYAGSFGGWYLTDQMLDFFTAAREVDPNAFVMILTQRDKEKITELLKERNFREEDFLVESVSPAEIPLYLNCADLAISFIKNCYSKKSSSPTKIAEYLACGVPIVANPGVGDVDEHLTKDATGVLIEDFNKESYLKAIEQIKELSKDGDLTERCRSSARQRFDLEKVGGEKYRRLYKKLFTSKKDYEDRTTF